MVQAWYMDSSDADQRLPHQLDPPETVSLDYLKKVGVLYWKINPGTFEKEGKLATVKKERGYRYSNELICTPEKLPNYHQKLKAFYEEHFHSDEEIRIILDGSGYFDVRNPDDRWIRILVEKGDFIIIPAGIYHRFTVDSNDYMKTTRLFIDDPEWSPIYRPTNALLPTDSDFHPARASYLKGVKDGSLAHW